MTPIPPPEDADMWLRICASFGRMVLGYVEWIERMLPIMCPAFVAAYLMGKRLKYKGAALRLYMLTGIFCAVVGVPVVLNYFGLDGSVWTMGLSSLMSIYCYKMFRWGELWVLRKLRIDRRDRGRGDNDGYGYGSGRGYSDSDDWFERKRGGGD